MSFNEYYGGKFLWGCLCSCFCWRKGERYCYKNRSSIILNRNRLVYFETAFNMFQIICQLISPLKKVTVPIAAELRYQEQKKKQNKTQQNKNTLSSLVIVAGEVFLGTVDLMINSLVQ